MRKPTARRKSAALNRRAASAAARSVGWRDGPTLAQRREYPRRLWLERSVEEAQIRGARPER